MSPVPTSNPSFEKFELLYPVDDVFFPVGEIREFLIEVEIEIERDRMKWALRDNGHFG